VDVVRPKEHGSWSLVLEPLVLGLLAAPSGAGLALAIAVMAMFFARRPLRMLATEPEPTRRAPAVRAVAVCLGVGVAAWVVAVALRSFAWLPWLAPTAIGGAAFLYFDLRRAGREQAAEIAVSAAFAWLPAAFAAMSGLSTYSACALGAVMIARALPTVLVVRATIRARKANRAPSALPLAVALVAVAGVGWLARSGLAPWLAFVAVCALAVRAFLLLVWPRPTLRASTIGMIEAVLGAAYVLAIGFAW
jgi:hypothetical protein